MSSDLPGPPPAPPAHTPVPRPSNGPNKGLIIGLVCGVVGLVLIGLLIVLLIVLGGGNSPDAAAEKYARAQIELDCDELVKHEITGFDGDIDACEDDADRQREFYDDTDLDIDSIDISELTVTIDDESDDEATVTVEATIDYVQDGEDQSDEEESTYLLTKDDDGHWNVSAFHAD